MELSAQELRIGNYINLDYPVSEDSKLVIVDIFHINEISKGQDKFKPIPLTEEWLLKFGFKEGVLENGNYKITISFYDIWRFRYQEKEGYGDADCYLENYWSVHELQNLYFALCGEELNLK